MNYVDKLFKQHPFVYCINNRYYAFGFGVCSKLDDNNSFLRNKYSLYIDSLKEEITDFEAWKIFLKVMNEASLKKEQLGIEKQEFNKLGFNEMEMKELESQIEMYREYFKVHKLKNFL